LLFVNSFATLLEVYNCIEPFCSTKCVEEKPDYTFEKIPENITDAIKFANKLNYKTTVKLRYF